MSAPETLCEDCPPVGYPTDKTRCLPCPRRMTDPLTARLSELLAAKARTPWLIHSEPDVNYPATIHSTHPLGNVGDPVEPLDDTDRELVVETINAHPTLLAERAILIAERAEARALLEPFAEAYAAMRSYIREDEMMADDVGIWRGDFGTGDLLVGHFRAARAYLTRTEDHG